MVGHAPSSIPGQNECFSVPAVFSLGHWHLLPLSGMFYFRNPGGSPFTSVYLSSSVLLAEAALRTSCTSGRSHLPTLLWSSPDMLGIHWLSVSTQPRPEPSEQGLGALRCHIPSVQRELRKCALINY